MHIRRLQQAVHIALRVCQPPEEAHGGLEEERGVERSRVRVSTCGAAAAVALSLGRDVKSSSDGEGERTVRVHLSHSGMLQNVQQQEQFELPHVPRAPGHRCQRVLEVAMVRPLFSG